MSQFAVSLESSPPFFHGQLFLSVITGLCCSIALFCRAATASTLITYYYCIINETFFVQADRVIKVLLSLLFRYSWKKDGRPFDWTVYNDRITQQAGRGTLVIKSPRDEDVGKFPSSRCIRASITFATHHLKEKASGASVSLLPKLSILLHLFFALLFLIPDQAF